MNNPDESRQDGTPLARARKHDAAATRAALTGAAALRFGRYGYNGTRVRDIAGDAGVDAALVYRYFGSKEALFEAVSTSTALFEPLRGLPLEDVAAWVRDVVLNAPTQGEVPHPVLSVLRSSGQEGAVARLRGEIAEVFSEGFAGRLEGPDAGLRAELLAAWLLGATLMRMAIGTPELVSASDGALLRCLRAGIDPLLDPPGGHEGPGERRPPGADPDPDPDLDPGTGTGP
ncbi:TetR/AcrR family transcriptional regulator [Streptomyces sp. NPDC051567]|uniref:TetR/AcrR family transcriptional regulator n=1 Tax=Streptomyces sp. NPDC051567 TaxID=3365660 RepID=UPI00378949C7